MLQFILISKMTTSSKLDINEVIRISFKDIPTKIFFDNKELPKFLLFSNLIYSGIQKLCISNYIMQLLSSYNSSNSLQIYETNKDFIIKMFYFLFENILTDPTKLQNDKLVNLLFRKITILYKDNFYNVNEIILYVKFTFILGAKSSTIIRYALILFNMIIDAKNDNNIANSLIFNIVKFIKENLIEHNNLVFLLSKLIDINDLLMFENIDINEQTQNELVDLLCQMNLFQFRKKFYDALVSSTINHFENVCNQFTLSLDAKIKLIQNIIKKENEHIKKDQYNFLNGFYFPPKHKEGIELVQMNYTRETIKNFSLVFSFKSLSKTENKIPLIELCEVDNKGKKTGTFLLRVFIEKNALYIEGKKEMKFPSNKTKDQSIPIFPNSSYLVLLSLSKQKNKIRLCAMKDNTKKDIQDDFRQFPNLNNNFSLLVGSSCTLQNHFVGYMGSVLIFNSFLTDDEIEGLIATKGNYDMLLYSNQNLQYIQKEFKPEIKTKLSNLNLNLMGMITTYGIKDYNRDKKNFKENAFDFEILNKAPKYFILAPLVKPIKTKISIYEFIKYDGIKFIQLHCEYYMQILERNENKKYYYNKIKNCIENILDLIFILFSHLKFEFFEQEQSNINYLNTYIDVPLTELPTYSNQITFLFSSLSQLILKINNEYKQCLESLIAKMLLIGTFLDEQENSLALSLRNKIIMFLFNKELYENDKKHLFNKTCEMVYQWIKHNDKGIIIIQFLEVVLSNKTLAYLNNTNYLEVIEFLIKRSLNSQTITLAFYVIIQLLTYNQLNEENIEFAYRMILILYNSFFEFYLNNNKDASNHSGTSIFDDQGDIIRNFIINEMQILNEFKLQSQEKLNSEQLEKIYMSEGHLIQISQLIYCDEFTLGKLIESISNSIPLVSLFLLVLKVIPPRKYSEIIISIKTNIEAISNTNQFKINYEKLDKKLEIMIKLFLILHSNKNTNKEILRKLISLIIYRIINENFESKPSNINVKQEISNTHNKRKNSITISNKLSEKQIALKNIFTNKNILYNYYLSWKIDNDLFNELTFIIKGILEHIDKPFIFKLLFILFIKVKNNTEQINGISLLYYQILQQIDNENCKNNNVALRNLFLSVIIVYKIISLAKYERDQDKKKEKFMPLLNYFSLNKIITNNIDIFWTRIKFNVGSLSKNDANLKQDNKKWKYISEIFIEIYIEAFLITKHSKFVNLLETFLFFQPENNKTIFNEVDIKIIEGIPEKKGLFSKLFSKGTVSSKISIEQFLKYEQNIKTLGQNFVKFSNVSFLVFYFIKFTFYSLNTKKNDSNQILSNFYTKIRKVILKEIHEIKIQIKSKSYENEYDEKIYQKFKYYFCYNFNRAILKIRTDSNTTNLQISLSDIDNLMMKKIKKDKYSQTYNDYFKCNYDRDYKIKQEYNEIEIRRHTKGYTKTFGDIKRKESLKLANFLENKLETNENEQENIFSDQHEDDNNIFADFILSRKELLDLISTTIETINKQNCINNNDDTSINKHYNLFPYFNSRKMFLFITFADYFKDIIYSNNSAFDFLVKKYKTKFYYTYKESPDITYLSYPSKLRNYFTKTSKIRVFLKPDLKFFTHRYIKVSHEDIYDYLAFKNNNLYFTNRLRLNKDKIIPTINIIKIFKCEYITINGAIFGEIYVTNNYLIYISKSHEDPRINSQNETDKFDYILSSLENDIIDGDKLFFIRYEQIEQIYQKRFLYIKQACEIFLKNGKCYYFNLFSLDNNEVFLKEIESITTGNNLNSKLITRNLTKQINEKQMDWLYHKITTFNYLSFLNFASDRSFNDVNQYPVFPWLTVLDINTSPSKIKLRDFASPVSVQNPDKKNQIISKFCLMPKNKHGFTSHFNSHYSAAAFVYFYLVRLNPFSYGMIKLQAGEFDNPNRIFHSFYEILEVLIKYSDNRELVPEIFYLPEMFLNLNFCNLGVRSADKFRNHNIIFEDYYQNYHHTIDLSSNNPVEFICRYRRLLESKNVSKNIHNWIDNVFGVCQFIKDYEKNKLRCNSFCKYSYEENISFINKLNSMKEKKLETSVIWKKIRNKICCVLNFGQCPKKIFDTPHPNRFINNENQNNTYKSKSNLQLSTILNDFDELSIQLQSVKMKKILSEQKLPEFDDSKEIDDVLCFKSISFGDQKKYCILQKIPNKGKQLLVYKKGDASPVIIPINNFSSGHYHYLKHRPMFNKLSKNNSSSLTLSSKIKNIYDFENTFAYYNTSSEQENGLYIFTNFYDNSIKCYFGNQKQPFSFVTSSFVTSIKRINKREFITGHENGTIVHWLLHINDTQETHSVSLEKKKYVLSQKSPVLCLNYDLETNVVIIGSKEGIVTLRNLYSFELLNVIKIQNTKKHQFAVINAKINKMNGFLYILGYNKNKDTYSLFGYTVNGVRFSVLDNIAGSFHILKNGLIMCYSYGEQTFVIVRGENLTKFKTKIEFENDDAVEKIVKFLFLENELRIKFLKIKKYNEKKNRMVLEELKISKKTMNEINKEEDNKEEGKMSIWDSIEYESDIKVFGKENTFTKNEEHQIIEVDDNEQNEMILDDKNFMDIEDEELQFK